MALNITRGHILSTVHNAIQFDDELCAMTDEIHEVRPDRRLTSKMRALDAELAEFCPQALLRRRSFAAEAARYCDCTLTEFRD